MQRETISVQVGAQEIVFETGKIARQAGGAVVVRCGETIVFTSACAAPTADPETDFFPLRVDYQEKFSSAGKTLGGFIKREGRPTEREILVSRLIDRPLRPMFEEGYYNEVQILSYVWSYDGVHSPEPLAICGASAALVISDAPLIKPVGAVRVGFIDGRFVVNPTIEQQKLSKLDLMLAGTEEAVLMIEGFCDFLTEEQVLEAIETGHKSIKVICQALEQWKTKVGKAKNRETLRLLPKELYNDIEAIANPLLESALRIQQKQKREEALANVAKAVNDSLMPAGQEPKYPAQHISYALKDISSKMMRRMILNENLRSDGRKSTEIRQIDVEQSLLPRVHGSSLFTRGETQAVAVCTLGGAGMAQRFEDLEGEGNQRFYLQYFFPPFSVGEVGRIGAPGRREVGHGKLAERALMAVIPPKEQFPYTIRVESNITESNGSSSMATVCGGCLALMDAGVPVKRPVSGIAMGLILEGDRYIILSDILGIEDALGDMDFKVTGDHQGITAFQMDIKVEGITIDIMRAALQQAKDGRIHILNKMLAVCPTFKGEMSRYAPRIETIQIKPSKIATVIGPGGKQIRAIIEQTGVQIDIDDSGLVSIAANDLDSIEKAKAIIYGLTAEIEIGRVYTGKATSIAPFGVFVEILPGKEGLCHISEFDVSRINNLEDFVKQGDIVTVKVLDINERGQIKLSRKATLQAQ
ncbi:Polyribonucleotide nucleotidyltransferase [Candidatus Protochlamydia naegleriophila]|uniref:Polyribonucleotide nucleotidyltransferase n=1 Tax=Candidatus Protochlamydia naegleriophila TaxID=389348 RepID=A0A0U5K4K7_9BACT|nr:polyribonucleotide nucleotidyltransferase [Candidatus Protochlamydia naegleriophila]CUI17019.1 Polyribonucleotide nucleotidyltransferase [Candidatus Protochlamydia naegleriophila]